MTVELLESKSKTDLPKKPKITHIHIDISSAFIPFSQIFDKPGVDDVYSGNEKMPFEDRIPDFKIILTQEFNK